MIGAVVLTKHEPPQLAVLQHDLAHDGVIVLTLRPEQVSEAIHSRWNFGIDTLSGTCSEIAIINDDVTMLPGTLPLMAQALRSDPKVGMVYADMSFDPALRLALSRGLPPEIHLTRTIGSHRFDGLAAACFMFRAEIGLRFDEGYRYYYGDDAIEESCREQGYDVARIDGLPLEHAAEATINPRDPETAALIELDRQRWEGRHASHLS